ncbi:uncharacterized protein [Asterias amurensis]|uniref:uncharacterized protein isoform X2 n=1 Tax=Asterias amurensis TaxID=7602 RepID=UPI003AB7DCA2
MDMWRFGKWSLLLIHHGGRNSGSMDTLTSLCLQQVSKSVSDVGYCSLEEIAVLPTQLLLDLAPLLSAGNLAVLHPIFLRKDIQSLKVQRILHNPFCNPSDDVISRTGKSLEDYFPSSLCLESRLLPYIQTNPVSMYSLQRNLKELVLSHYLPKYKQVLKTFLEQLIHGGVLRKLTLKHPKCLTPGELFSILDVCAVRRFEDISIQDCNLRALRHLMLSSNLETLELHSTDFEFLSDAESVNGSDGQLLLHEIAEAFSQLRTINLSQNKLRSLLCLERALLHPKSNITHLALERCQLTTEMLDVFFLHVKDSPSLRELNVNFNTYTPGRTGQLSGLVQLLQSNKLTKLDLVGCGFNLQGWIHANDFITALRNNLCLRQLGLALNSLGDRCLQLFAEVFVCRSPDTPENGILTPRLCFDISNNFQVTYEGREAFFRTLHHASKTPGLRVNPPCHLITSMAKYHHDHSDSEYLRVAKALRMTITEVQHFR